MIVLQEVLEHWAAHNAETDKPYCCHLSSPLRGNQIDSLALAESCSDIFCVARQQAHIAARCCKVEPHIEKRFDVVRIPSECPRGFACRADAPGRILDRRLHLGVPGIAQMAKIRGKIAGADEEAIDTFNSCDRFDFRKRRSAFQLHQDANIKVCVMMVALDASVVVGARHYRDSANAKRRIASGGDRLARLFGVLNEWNEKRASTDIESALEHHRVIPRKPEYRLGGAATHCLQLGKQRWDIVRRMFTINDDPVKACAGNDLRGYRTRQTAPESNLPRTI